MTAAGGRLGARPARRGATWWGQIAALTPLLVSAHCGRAPEPVAPDRAAGGVALERSSSMAAARSPSAPALPEETPLHRAAFDGDVVAIRRLLQEGADPNALTRRDDTPLLRALEYHHLEAAQALLDGGASVEGVQGLRALSLVSMHGERAWVKELLRRGVRADGVEPAWGTTPLLAAARSGQVEVMRELVRAGAQVNVGDHEGMTPLHEAARAGHLEACRWLLDAKASLEALNQQGQSPLFEAIHASRPIEIHRYRIPLGEDDGRGPHTTEFKPRPEAPIVKLFLERGASLGVIEAWGYSPLHYAVLERSAPALRLLLQRGAARDVKNHEGETPLEMARRLGYRDLVELLAAP